MISERLKHLRNDCELTQKDLATYLGLTPKMISFYELGQRVPPPDVLVKIADRFNVTIDYLLGRTSEKTFSTPLNEYEQKVVDIIREFTPEYQLELIGILRREARLLKNDIK